MNVLIWDTETQGLPDWKKPSDDPVQPHLCQFTAVLFDSHTFEELEYVDMLIKPDGWEISEEVSKLHGITQERALAEGKPEKLAVASFLALIAKAQRVSGFNIDFDLRIMRIAMLRAGLPKATCDTIRESLKVIKHDIMRQCTPICKLSPTDKMMAAGIKAFKSPTLAEAMLAIFGEVMDDAHDARADVAASLRLYQDPTQEPPMRKIVSLHAFPAWSDSPVALCDDGSVWAMTTRGWEKWEAIPQDPEAMPGEREPKTSTQKAAKFQPNGYSIWCVDLNEMRWKVLAGAHLL